MKPQEFSVSWVDLMVVVLLGVGIWRGRKRGMSEELIDIVKWALIVVIAGLLYEPSGRFLAQMTSIFSPLSCNLAAYIALAFAVIGLCAMVKKSVGDKVVGSDTFGSAEYYLGMIAGAFRYACIMLVGMAFLNARYYTPEEVAASTKYQLDNYGSSFFMTVPDLQTEVFHRSFAGRLTHEHLNVVLIRPTSGEGRDLGGEDSVSKRRERTVGDAYVR
jgi:uncharacterized membrane protein required for colicin V production